MKNNLHYGPTYVLTVNVAFGEDGLMKDLRCPDGVPSDVSSDIPEQHAAFLVALHGDFEASGLNPLPPKTDSSFRLVEGATSNFAPTCCN
jgi:hypothetical protein